MALIEQFGEMLGRALEDVSSSHTPADLDAVNVKFLGRRGELAELMKKLPSLPAEERPDAGMRANDVKRQIQAALENRALSFGGDKPKAKSTLDVTWPGVKIPRGHLHPITQFIRKVEDIFVSMGFEVVDGPEVDTEKNNFDLLNIPKDHPSRDIMDTFYLTNGAVLRTHTSPVQLRAMETRKPPVRLVYPGRTFRHEATDASHETTFYQYECLVIDQGITVANLLDALNSFFKTLFGPQVKIRVVSSYFPFVEPGLEVSMSCLICEGKGCSVCKKTGWLEMLGSGMVHPRVLTNMGIDPEKYSGYAFGGGLDRLVMLYYGIDDIRLLYGGDLRFLEQF
ncbi:MAG: phenylalanine--tRNA ligase subunit alpha [Patescibacteria group bacterium]|jgi:phenylalanyl-tRNA synthetase alpha chain